MEEADEVRARAHHEAGVGEGTLNRARATELLAALENEDRATGACEIRGGGETVVAAADDDGIPRSRGQLGDARSRHRAMMPMCPP